MAISEGDRQLLQDLENDLLDRRRSPRTFIKRRATRLLLASAGLLLGLLVLFAGLRSASALGTGVGVAGSTIFIASAWLGLREVRPHGRGF